MSQSPELHVADTSTIEAIPPAELIEMLEAVKALTANYQRKFEARHVLEEQLRDLSEELTGDREERGQVLKKFLEELQKQYDQGSIANDVTAALWSEATGNEYPAELIDQINKVGEGTPILSSIAHKNRAIVAHGVSVSWQSTLSPDAKACSEDGKQFIAIYETDPYIGSEAIIAHLMGSIENYKTLRNHKSPFSNLARYYHDEQLARRIGVEIPDELVELSDATTSEALADTRFEDFSHAIEAADAFLLVQLDALYRRRTDNVDLLMTRISQDVYDNWANRIGIMIDYAKNGKKSIFYNKTTDELLSLKSEAREIAFSRYGTQLNAGSAATATA